MIVVFVDYDLDNEVKRNMIKRDARKQLKNIWKVSFVDEKEWETRTVLNFLNDENNKFLSYSAHKELADVVMITNNLVAFAYCEVPVDKKYIYYDNFFANITALNSNEPEKIDGGYIVRSYVFGDITEEKVSGWGVINEMGELINDFLLDVNNASNTIDELSMKLSKHLFEKGIRPTKGDGMVIVDGEVSIVPPELVEKVKNLLG